ncbi:MAG: hypothetical protein WC070_04025 [Candidatus Magasanikbacteria bacterium]
MKFVETYLKKHHLFRTPHKWFLAFLSSPIHLAELHYKKRYHLQFAHARKLFIFDMLLFFGVFIILSAGIFWKLYDPTVTDLVYLSIEKEPHRVLSGEDFNFEVVYKNESEVKLVSPKLILQLPDGFVLQKTEPENNFDKNKNTFYLSDLAKNDAGKVSIFGRIYETPHLETQIIASLEYQQEGKKHLEKASTPFIAILRGSVLKSFFNIADKALSHSSLAFDLTIKNDGDTPIEKIKIPLPNISGITLLNEKITKGKIANNIWEIDNLLAKEESILTAYFNFNIKNKNSQIALEIVPKVIINEKEIAQEKIQKNIQIFYPNLTINSNFENDLTQVLPGENINLYLNLQNTGDVDLKNLKITLPVDTNIIDKNKFVTLNKLTIEKNNIYLDYENNPNLKKLDKNKNIELKLILPILEYPKGNTDLLLGLNPQIEAQLNDINNVYKTDFETNKIKIGTNIFTTAEIRYFTKEGDQLGRGPLPIKIGEETKYWALIEIQNTTSRISNINFKATLPSYVKWTGKSSVSIGRDLSFDPITRNISWSSERLAANSNAGIYFELSVTPDATMIENNLIMLKNINITGLDSFLNVYLNKNLANLDNSLKTDTIGKNKMTSDEISE